MMMTRRMVGGIAAAACALISTGDGRAEIAAFDLAGPRLTVTVKHGGVTLPITQVPNLSAGDEVLVRADLPVDQGARYLLVVGFLRGATNPPPKNWFFKAETWKPKNRDLRLTVPKGAQQVVAFLAPETGGDFGTLTGAVRGRPGAFVRASQDLNQAALDRARLDTYVAGVNRRDAEGGSRVEVASPLLARSLAIQLKADCLAKPAELQAGCLTAGRDSLVLSDGHSSSLAEALTGTPTDLAFQLAATPQGGLGYYSPYIGVVRDVARLLGAFRTANYQYIPALATHDGDALALLLNAAPSFSKPLSVLVTALPPVGPASLPPLRATEPAARYCLARPGLALPVEGAPLIYATRYARNVALRVAGRDGREIDLPVVADAEKGGFVVKGDLPRASAFEPELTGRLHGEWGFVPFDGPRFALQSPQGPSWHPDDGDGATLVAGRDNALALTGAAPACVANIEIKLPGGNTRAVTWEQRGANGLTAKLPLGDVPPGDVTVRIGQYGVADPIEFKLTAYAEASRIDSFTLHADDRSGVLTGARLDKVAALTIDGSRFVPGALARVEGGDRLTLTAEAAPALAVGDAKTGKVTLIDKRIVNARVTVAPPRPAATLIGRSVTVPATPVAIALPEGVVSQYGRLTFSLRAAGGTRFATDDRVEVATADDATTTVGVSLQDPQVAVVSLTPGAVLGVGAAGPLRFRLVQGGVASDWQPLGTLARVPTLRTAACKDSCTVTGSDLFLLRSVGGAAMPEGFTGDSLSAPKPASGPLPVSLRDAPDVAASIEVTR
ncbi:hypothetical protein [Sphingomonas mollis]|nr:hypothetical protein [Sphingomonas sp. BT553]